MSQIPITREYAAAVGDWCERVENRSLLLDKFAFPKIWGDGNKENSASFWSLMRIASNGAILLQQKAADLERKARGKNVETEEKRDRLLEEARHCRALSGTKTGAGLEPLRPRHTARFLELLRTAYPAERLRILNGLLEGRLAINLAEGLIQNAGIMLDRIFGLPFIPGSAVKGVVRATALAEVRQNPALLKTFARVFGTAESDYAQKGDLKDFSCPSGLPQTLQGAVVFMQAIPTNEAKIVADITTVHYPKYYRTGNPSDEKEEGPLPNTFPTVERGAEFAFPILLNRLSDDITLLETAERWLANAMEQHGFGAKTAAGYGWFTDIGKEKQRLEAIRIKAEQEEHARRQAEIAERQKTPIDAALVQQLSRLDEAKLRQKLDAYCVSPQGWRTPEAEQRALLEVPRLKTLWSQNKANPSARISRAIKNLADKFGVQLP